MSGLSARPFLKMLLLIADATPIPMMNPKMKRTTATKTRMKEFSPPGFADIQKLR